ncbi:MAG: hypothetical protein JOZ65_08170 [Chloroflexi bacterium]|nr:hypothetical protein [Chloroflexota bacterium]
MARQSKEPPKQPARIEDRRKPTSEPPKQAPPDHHDTLAPTGMEQEPTQ